MAATDDAWEHVVAAAGDYTSLTGYVVAVKDDGLMLDLDGVRAFLPAHLVEAEPRDELDLTEYATETLDVVALELNRARRSCVVTRRPRVA